MKHYLSVRALRTHTGIKSRIRGYYHPNVQEAAEGQATADVVLDTPRNPRIIQTGILDERGDMLLRVVMPIRLPRIGFGPHPNAPRFDETDEVHYLVPESMLHTVEDSPGEGTDHVHPDDVEDDSVEVTEAVVEQAHKLEEMIQQLREDVEGLDAK